ncbi:hypothetical protein ACJMK2_011329 [Sinanodonta woodiana]|uniref:Flavin-containing monooxygenase n=1 Tax=Sinanodonta woodiana TaxID=1069815 RepID=A0ABD3V4P2_SINWO
MKRVAIIGAGCSGLAAIKSCLEDGFEPVCFERDDDIGGLWRYSTTSKVGNGSVYKTCVINTSKEMMSFSDFPPPQEFPMFMPHRFVLKYFRMYAESFGLIKYINFKTSVENIIPATDYGLSGQWRVTYISGDGESKTEVFDGVLVCTGHHTYPHIPEFEGLETFTGKYIHSHGYKENVEFTGKRVLVVDGTFLEIDAIIFATGFDYKLSFIPESVTRIQNNRTELYKYMFPPHLKNPTIAVIGLVQSIGSVMPISEMQCRWFMKVMKGECELPSEEIMMEDIQAKREAMEKTYVKSKRHTLQCFWVEYMDELADMIGVKPDLWKLFFEDPKLAIRCIFGPCVPAQYRLMGPGSWNGAKSTIKGSVQRCLFPTRTKLLPKNATGKENQSLYSFSIPRHLHPYFIILFIVFIFFHLCIV